MALPIRTRYSPSYRPAALLLTKPNSPQEQNRVAKWQRGDRKGRAGPGEPWVDRHHCKQTNSRLWRRSDPEKHLAIRDSWEAPCTRQDTGKIFRPLPAQSPKLKNAVKDLEQEVPRCKFKFIEMQETERGGFNPTCKKKVGKSTKCSEIGYL